MLTDQDIRTLAEFESHDVPVLSVYLSLSPQRRSGDAIRLALRALLDQASGANPQDIERVQSFVETGFNWQGQGLVIFSCVKKGFWWERTFAVPIQDASYVSFRPNIRQLADLKDKYQRYGVIHVDSEGARLYDFNMGDLVAVDGYLGEEVKMHKAGGWSSPRYQRHERGMATNNLQEAAEAAEDFYRSQKTRHLILAGTEKNVALFNNLLSNRLRSIVVGSIPAPANASPAAIRERALEVVQKAAEEEQRAMADEIVARASQGDRAVVGLAQTLTAVQENRADHVAVISSFAQPAFRFVDSGMITLEITEDGALGSGRIQELPDAVESVLRRALAQGIGVTILEEHEKLQEAGNIGAILRY